MQDLPAGFFIIVEKQYWVRRLVELSMVGSPENAAGGGGHHAAGDQAAFNGEVFTVPNGNIVRISQPVQGLGRAVVDISVPRPAPISAA